MRRRPGAPLTAEGDATLELSERERVASDRAAIRNAHRHPPTGAGAPALGEVDEAASDASSRSGGDFEDTPIHSVETAVSGNPTIDDSS